MAKISNPKRFSAHFGISPDVLRKEGALDPILNVDTRLFIDPLLLKKSKHPEIRPAHAAWAAHFGKIIKLLAVAKDEDDPPYRAAYKMFDFPEFKGTCLGYGAGITGSGIGDGLRRRLLATASRIIELGVTDPELFALMPLIEKDIGADRISDMTTRIIARHLCDFTVRVLAKTRGAQKESFRILGTQYQLPRNPFVQDQGAPLPVVLVPRDILRSLPIAMDWSGIADAAAENHALRSRVNEKIGQQWRAFQSKQQRRKVLLSSKERLASVIDSLKKTEERNYNVEADSEGLVQWLEAGEKIAAESPATLSLITRDLAGVTSVVETIIEEFKHSIEKGAWRLLYDDDMEPRHEKFSQLTFGVVAESYCKANNVEISPETDQGSGAVDFKLSVGYDSRVLVELKLSSNPNLLHGYESQLETYKSGERTTAGYYVVLDNGRGEHQLNNLIKAETAAKNANAKYSPIIVIDAEPKPSASKRKQNKGATHE